MVGVHLQEQMHGMMRLDVTLLVGDVPGPRGEPAA
jgi:hypothetical protein